VKGLIGYNGWATVIEKYVHPLVKNKILEKFGENFISLRNEYFTCIKILSPNSTDKDIEILYKNLIENYSSFVYLDEKITIKRYYHNIDHVFSGLKFLIENKDLIKQNYCYENIVLAWIYHDIIYKINFNKNEELSADLCVQSLRSVGVKEENLKEIHRLIMLTKHKENPFDNDFLGNIIVDIDLISIANKEEFDKNSSLIRKEYSIYSDSEYSKGRIMFFESLLNKKERKVLRSDLFKNLNERAVENIEKQIQELKGVV
jgi:predicted metal-dependent HD superfamily phosphohydrolase